MLIIKKMKKQLLIITIVTSVALLSCKGKKDKEAETIKQTETPAQNDVKKNAEDKIVISNITNKDGDKLDITYNNTKRTATLIFKGETIEMKQDTIGSGIKYSNEKYVFSEWHGQTELKKEGKTIFKNIEDGKVQKK